MNFIDIANMPEAERAAYMDQRFIESMVRMRQSHDRVYPACGLWTADVAVDHGGRKPMSWTWHGCPTHCPTTRNGIPSDRMVEHARLVMLASLVAA